MENPIYKVIEKNEEVPELSKIEKSGIVTTITLDNTIKAFEENAKGMKQIEAELKLKKALRTNVENNHPEIFDIDEKTQLMCHTYYEAGRFIKFAEEKLAEFADAQKDLEKEIKDIEEQTGIKKTTAKEVVEEITKKDNE